MKLTNNVFSRIFPTTIKKFRSQTGAHLTDLDIKELEASPDLTIWMQPKHDNCNNMFHGHFTNNLWELLQMLLYFIWSMFDNSWQFSIYLWILYNYINIVIAPPPILNLFIIISISSQLFINYYHGKWKMLNRTNNNPVFQTKCAMITIM